MSFYTSLSGLKNAQTDLNVIAHNIANAETNGFKKSRAEFADIVAGTATTNPKLSQGMGSTVDVIAQDFTVGPIEQTGAALDLAISGEGFFTTKGLDNDSILYTRNGSFKIDEEGNIQDGADNVLQMFEPDADPETDQAIDAKVPLTSTGGAAFAGLVIDTDGSVVASYVDGSNTTIGKVALASFVSPGGLKQVGSSSWESTGFSGEAKFGTPDTGSFGGLLSGSIERSNVDISEELVSLITAQRYFQANAKAIDTATQISQTVINLRT